MTESEKARAYDKALEKAKKIHDNAKELRCVVEAVNLETIFPELKESEETKPKRLFLKKDMSFDEGKLYRCTGIKSKDNIAYVDLEEAKINPKEVEYSTMLQSIWGKICELEGKFGDIYKAISKPYQDIKQPVSIPSNPMQCWFPDGTCMNPYHDCVNCPRPYSKGNKSYTSTTTSIKPNEVMYDGNPINDQEKKD